MSFSNNAIFQDYESSDTNSAYAKLQDFNLRALGVLSRKTFRPTEEKISNSAESTDRKIYLSEREREGKSF